MLSNSVVKQDHIDVVMKFQVFGCLPGFHWLIVRNHSNGIRRTIPPFDPSELIAPGLALSVHRSKCQYLSCCSLSFFLSLSLTSLAVRHFTEAVHVLFAPGCLPQI